MAVPIPFTNLQPPPFTNLQLPPFTNLQPPPMTKIISYPFPSINRLKFNTRPNRTLTHLNCLTSLQPSPSSPHSDSTSFQVSYLINTFDFSPQFASKLCSIRRLCFKTTEKPDSVTNFFRNYGFSNSQLRDIIAKAPWLLSCNPSKTVLPKFQFFLSKGASNSDIVCLVSKNPQILSSSLEKHIVPTYEMLYRFMQSDRDLIASVISNPELLWGSHVRLNITMLLENGVSDSNIMRIFRTRNRALQRDDLLSLLEELKDLGFNPSKTTFGVAFIAKTSVNKIKWKEKVDAFNKWGWSDEDVVKAFKKQPHCMLNSIEKINLVMDFWVNQLGWDALVLAKHPSIFSSSFEKRIAPRALVVQFLRNNGLRNKNASLASPFSLPEQEFLDKFIKRYEKESSFLLNLYAGTKLASHD
ncbi:unnamed protein product [Lathyrus sativus]|nr:unnamed protein product [Lathyrus sativus]